MQSCPAMAGSAPACVLGIDLGTTSVKAALLEGTERGQVVAGSCSRETQAYTSSLEAGPQVDKWLLEIELKCSLLFKKVKYSCFKKESGSGKLLKTTKTDLP